MKNIFENAYFGKAYKTRDGRKAIFLGWSKLHPGCYEVRIEGYTTNSYYGFDGFYFVNHLGSCCDIVSEWQDGANEEEPGKLVQEHKGKAINANGYEFVDLGLPSGKKWMKYNLGATSETEYGDYYMWGSTAPDTDQPCDWAHAPFNNGSSDFDETYFNTHKLEWLDKNSNLKPQYDAVYQATNGVAHMATEEDMQELVDNTTSKWETDYQGTGIKGRLFTSKTNGNSIFIPASGFRCDSAFDDQGCLAGLWSSSLLPSSPDYAMKLFFNSVWVNANEDFSRIFGYAVRGVL